VPEEPVLVHHRERLDRGAGRARKVGEVVEALHAHGARVRLDAEGVLEAALGDVVGHRHRDDERGLLLLRELGDVVRDRALVRAEHRHDALPDQPLRLGGPDLGLPLAVPAGEREPGSTLRLDPAGGVDLLDGEGEAVHHEPAVERERAGQGVDVTHADLAGLGAQHGREAEHRGAGDASAPEKAAAGDVSGCLHDGSSWAVAFLVP